MLKKPHNGPAKGAGVGGPAQGMGHGGPARGAAGLPFTAGNQMATLEWRNEPYRALARNERHAAILERMWATAMGYVAEASSVQIQASQAYLDRELGKSVQRNENMNTEITLTDEQRRAAWEAVKRRDATE